MDSVADKLLYLNELPIGGRLLVQCRNDWRVAAVSAVGIEKVVLIISSPSGRTYRKSYPVETEIEFEGPIPVLGQGVWRESLAVYDIRW